MMRKVVIGMSVVAVSALAGLGSLRHAAARSEIERRFIGTWRLVSIEGPPNPNRGAHPTGVIYYDATGQMAAQIMPDRPRPDWTGSPTPEQARETILGYTAYFGTYSVDEGARTVTHHRAGTLSPGPVDFVRHYEFVAGNRLVLTPVSGPAIHLTWELIK
jgi:hypothetical protein